MQVALIPGIDYEGTSHQTSLSQFKSSLTCLKEQFGVLYILCAAYLSQATSNYGASFEMAPVRHDKVNLITTRWSFPEYHCRIL